MKNCSICDSDLEDDDIKGWLGQTEFGFCPWCYSSLSQMFNPTEE